MACIGMGQNLYLGQITAIFSGLKTAAQANLLFYITPLFIREVPSLVGSLGALSGGLALLHGHVRLCIGICLPHLVGVV